MFDFDEINVDLGVFWPSEYDVNIWFAPASSNIDLQKKKLQWLYNEAPMALILCKNLPKAIIQHQDQEAQ